MAIFMSFSSKDELVVKSLARGFEAAHRQVWFDHDLKGGEIWWETILHNIRESSVFLFALSDNSLKSPACRAELEYAIALRRPILPVLVGHVSTIRSHALAGHQHVPFRPDDTEAAFAVLDAADRAGERDVPLPEPLPTEPATPFAYIGVIRQQIEGGPLDHPAQLGIVERLRRSLGEETDVAAREEIVSMLQTLAGQPWRTAHAELEIEALLAAYEEMERRRAGATTKPIGTRTDGAPALDHVELPASETTVHQPDSGQAESEPGSLSVESRPGSAEWATRTTFMAKVGEMVDSLQEGRAYRERTGERDTTPTVPRTFVAPSGPTLVVGDGPASEVAMILAARAGPVAGAGPRPFSGPPPDAPYFPGVDRPGGSVRGGDVGPATPRAYVTLAAADVKKPPMGAGSAAVPGSAQATAPTTRRSLQIVALVLCGLFAVFVAVAGRVSTAVTFTLPAAFALVGLSFSVRAAKMLAAGRAVEARSASRTATVWGVVAVVVAVALAVILNASAAG
jgi:hypothetical protein